MDRRANRKVNKNNNESRARIKVKKLSAGKTRLLVANNDCMTAGSTQARLARCR